MSINKSKKRTNSKLKRFKSRKIIKGGSTPVGQKEGANKDIFGDDFKNRFSFFPKEKKGFELQDYKERYYIYNELGIKTITKGGNVVKTQKINEYSINTNKLAVNREFEAIMDKLIENEETLNKKLNKNFNNTAIYLYNSHGGYHKIEDELITIPQNTYICFLTPLDYLAAIKPYEDNYEDDFKFQFDKLNTTLYKKIFKYRANLSDNSSGVIDEDYFLNIDSLNYALECFEGSTWYYPGQSCYNILLQFQNNDIIQGRNYFDIERRYTRYGYENIGGKESIIQSIDYEEHKKFYDIFLRNKSDSKKIYDYFTNLRNILEKNIYQNEDYKIIIFSGCRNLDLPEHVNKKLFMYEAFIHFINLNIYKNTGEDIDKKKCLLNCYTEQHNNVRLKRKQFKDFDNMYNFNPNNSRLTPFMIEIYEKLEKGFKDNKSNSFDEIPKILNESEYKYLMQAGNRKFFLFNLKLLKFIKEKEGTKNYAYYEKFIYNFVFLNIRFINYYIGFFFNPHSEILKIYNYYKNTDLGSDQTEFIKDFIDFYTLLFCVIKNIQKKKKIGVDKLAIINVLDIELFYSNDKLSDYFTIKGEKELNSDHFLERKHQLKTYYDQFDKEEKFSFIRNYFLRDCIENLCFTNKEFNDKVKLQKIGDIYTNIKKLKFINCNFINYELDKFLDDNKLNKITELELNNTILKENETLNFKSFSFLNSITLVNVKVEEELNIKGLNLNCVQLSFCRELKSINIENTSIKEFKCGYCKELKDITISNNPEICVFSLKNCRLENIYIDSGNYDFTLSNITIKNTFDYFDDYETNTDKIVKGINITDSTFHKNIKFFNVMKKDIRIFNKFIFRNSKYMTEYLNKDLLDDIVKRGESGEFPVYYLLPIEIKNIQNLKLKTEKKDTLDKFKWIGDRFEEFNYLHFMGGNALQAALDKITRDLSDNSDDGFGG